MEKPCGSHGFLIGTLAGSTSIHLPFFGMIFPGNRLKQLFVAALSLEQLPFTILVVLCAVSLVSRIILVLR